MTRAELREAAKEEWLRERLGQDVRQLVLRLDLVEMNVTFLYRLMRAVYPEVDVTGPVTAADHVVGPLDAPGVLSSPIGVGRRMGVSSSAHRRRR